MNNFFKQILSIFPELGDPYWFKFEYRPGTDVPPYRLYDLRTGEINCYYTPRSFYYYIKHNLDCILEG